MDDSHNITVALRLLAPSTNESVKGEPGEVVRLEEGDKKGVLKVTIGELQQEENEPHPSQQTSNLIFDEVYSCSSETKEQDIHKARVSPLINSVLEGFNGTVLSLGNQSMLGDAVQTQKGLIIRAARQIFNTLKRLKKSGVTANLVVPCTFLMLCDETLYDLFHQLPGDRVGEIRENKGPVLEMSELLDCITSEAKRVNGVKKLLEHGQVMMEKYLRCHSSDSLRHTVFTIGVKYSEFGSLFSPISGTLSFISISKPDLLDVNQLLTSQELPATACSIRDFFVTISTLTQTSSLLPGTPELTHRSEEATSDALKGSKLKPLLKDALGGNCKTLLICNSPSVTHCSSHEQILSSLQLLSKARNITNKPDKTELAKKALMDAYMKELRKLYGNAPGKGGREEGQLDEVTSDNKDAEFAAKALATAVREGNESEGSDSEDDETSLDKSIGSEHTKSGSQKKMKRRFTLNMFGTLESSGPQETTSEDLTIEALVSVIQEPDKGVPRALTGALEDVKIHRGKGAVFSGADIVTWLVKNIAGVENEEDAEKIGQILLDKGAIFHSEGASVFFNSSYLFYYAREARQLAKPLTQEEIQALLGHGSKGPKEQTLTADQSNRNKGNDLKSPEREQFFNVEDTIKPMSQKLQPIHISSPTSPSQPISGPHLLPPLQKSNSIIEENDPEPSTLTATLVPQKLVDSTGYSNTEEPDFPSVEATLVPQAAQQPTSDGQLTTEDTASSHEHQRNQEPDDNYDYLDDENADPKTPSNETAPNLKAFERVPDLQTLESCSDYPHPLHYQAATKNDAGVIKHLIHWYGVDQLDDRHRTPLMFAALGNKATSCRTLLEYGSVPDNRDKSGLTAVHIACYHGHKEALAVLASKGANVAIKDKMLHSAFHWSVVPPTTHCLKIVLRYSHKHNLEREEDKNGLTPIHWAIFYDHPEHLKLLLQRCTDLTRVDKCGRNFAIYAIQNERLQCLECLLKACPVFAVHSDKHKLTALHHASALPSATYLQALLNSMTSKGQQVSLDIQDQYGRTPVHYAALYGHSEILNLLLKYSADRNPKDSSGRTPLQLRKAFGMEENRDIAELLERELTDGDKQNREESAVCIII
ncbi:PREDICTED: uncharacterized protein LOC109582743 isoform X2 [Amphimedon queenslandica]|uniref:DEP domain-containing protein n=1 Tax=Amphimedon queenslandica TaxID=400682 RepID=A0A1X7UP72_AMPQE|nr:PREDICTED: uncharacterized protein LOC109582743 isoform X2 [Amphimedon queenslandica]|eukprot:XP_019853211.1 PREDICTED: uncharacterized protein LOC109582743 isoform X2 [Amphimedon queenslandica]